MNDHLNDIRTIGIIAHIDAIASELVETVRLQQGRPATDRRARQLLDGSVRYRAVGS
ncbi:MAG: hypothetical protein ACKJSG_08460 [Lentisphaeria bacterium]